MFLFLRDNCRKVAMLTLRVRVMVRVRVSRVAVTQSLSFLTDFNLVHDEKSFKFLIGCPTFVGFNRF